MHTRAERRAKKEAIKIRLRAREKYLWRCYVRGYYIKWDFAPPNYTKIIKIRVPIKEKDRKAILRLVYRNERKWHYHYRHDNERWLWLDRQDLANVTRYRDSRCGMYTDLEDKIDFDNWVLGIESNE